MEHCAQIEVKRSGTSNGAKRNELMSETNQIEYKQCGTLRSNRSETEWNVEWSKAE